MSVFYYEQMLKNTDSTIRVYAEKGYSDPTITYEKGELVIKGNQSERELVLVAMLTDDLTVGIGNSFSDGSEDIITSTAKSIAESVKANSRFVGGAAENIKELIGKDNVISDALNTIAAKGQYHLLTYNDRVNMYNGSTVTCTIPINAFIYNNSQPESAGSFKTLSVKSAVRRLVDRIIGDVEDFSTKNADGTEGLFSDLNGYFAFQKPPNGYVAKMNNLSNKDQPFPPGTFTIEVGDLYIIKGLVITAANITMSKQKLKNRDGATDQPLFAEVSLTMEPAVQYLKSHLKDFLKI